MKTKKVFFVMALAAIVMLFSCSKDDDPSDPTSIIISRITVTEFPQHAGYFTIPLVGSNPIYWDLHNVSAPDIYPSIKQGTKTIVTCENSYKENAQNSNSYAFTINPVVNLDPTESYKIRLHDWDSGDDDLMGETDFKPYNGEDTPNQLLISGGGVSWTIDVKYSY